MNILFVCKVIERLKASVRPGGGIGWLRNGSGMKIAARRHDRAQWLRATASDPGKCTVKNHGKGDSSDRNISIEFGIESAVSITVMEDHSRGGIRFPVGFSLPRSDGYHRGNDDCEGSPNPFEIHKKLPRYGLNEEPIRLLYDDWHHQTIQCQTDQVIKLGFWNYTRNVSLRWKATFRRAPSYHIPG